MYVYIKTNGLRNKKIAKFSDMTYRPGIAISNIFYENKQLFLLKYKNGYNFEINRTHYCLKFKIEILLSTNI